MALDNWWLTLVNIFIHEDTGMCTNLYGFFSAIHWYMYPMFFVCLFFCLFFVYFRHPIGRSLSVNSGEGVGLHQSKDSMWNKWKSSREQYTVFHTFTCDKIFFLLLFCRVLWSWHYCCQILPYFICRHCHWWIWQNFSR